MIGFNTSGMAG